MTNTIKVIIGLGNPGQQYHFTRHNIGFLVIDELAQKYNASWQKKTNREETEIVINNHKIILIKPQTFMNDSGKIIPALLKQGIKAENILVIHDELEKPFGKIALKHEGSHRGHNGLRSIIQACGDNFLRLRCGIGRPELREDVPDYVLSNFSEKKECVEQMIGDAIMLIESSLC
jgi:PTH1 family peptidyl-tRNA hydrolase